MSHLDDAAGDRLRPFVFLGEEQERLDLRERLLVGPGVGEQADLASVVRGILEGPHSLSVVVVPRASSEVEQRGGLRQVAFHHPDVGERAVSGLDLPVSLHGSSIQDMRER